MADQSLPKMAEQALPNDVLQVIFSQLPSIRFILRRVQKLNLYWNRWAICSVSSFEIHPRDYYKQKLADVYKSFIEDSNIVFPNVADVALNFQAKQLRHFLSKFPKLERINLQRYKSDIVPFESEVNIAQIPSNIKQIIMKNHIFRTEPYNDDETDRVPRFDKLELYKGFIGPYMLQNLPWSIKTLHVLGNEGTPTLDLPKFTALEVLKLDNVQPITYAQMKSTTLRELSILVYRTGEEINWQKNFPQLKRLEWVENLNPNQLAEYKDMEVVDRPDRDYLNYDARFLKNNPNLIRLKMDTRQQMSDLDYLPNLKELLLRREVILPNVMKRVLTITTLEKLTLFGTFKEVKVGEEFTPNYSIKELTLKDTLATSTFFPVWAHLFRGVVNVRITDFSEEDLVLFSTHLKDWTRLEKLTLGALNGWRSNKLCYFPPFANLRKFNVTVCVDESIFSTLGQCPKLEVVEGFILKAGPTSSFLIENLIYGFLRAAKSLYYLDFTTKTPFKLVRERVESFIMPEAYIDIAYSFNRGQHTLYRRDALSN